MSKEPALELGGKIMDIPDAWGAPVKIENEKGAAVFHFANGVKISVPLVLLH
jgi:hypothetical protein